jgi:uncharacterized protein (DUF433 family)
MNAESIQIIDCGRGPQLANSRITVLDLVHYFQKGRSYDEIRRWIPTLTVEEIAAVERYYRQHQDEFDEKERRAGEAREEQIRQQRLQFPEAVGTPQEQAVRLRQLLEKRRQEANGEGHPR